MRRVMINNNEVQTEIITEGRWIEEDPLPHSSKHIVLVIPGNPGVPQFYVDFVKALNSKLTLDLPVWIVGHAGHVQPPENLRIAMPSTKKWEEYYGLSAQTRHKAEFIKKYVPEDAELHVIGHSVGAWMVLNLLKDSDVNRRIKKCYLLFPTVEYMAESRNGVFFNTFISPFSRLWLFLSWIFTTMFPLFLQMLIIRIFGIFRGIPAKFANLICEMIKPKVMYRIMNLAKDEMKYVKEADHETISKYADKLWFYYGTTDGWTPLKYHKNMISKHPDLNVQLCERGLRHAFVLKDNENMACIVGDLINENSR